MTDITSLHTLRALDENFWLPAVSSYQNTGRIAVEDLAQGPGIYYLVSAVGNVFHISYSEALVGLAVIFGALYPLAAFLLYRVFFEGNQRLALVATLLLSMSDAMIYSTTVARPTLFGLFLIPLAISAFQLLRRRFDWLKFLLLVLLSVMILIIHAPISFVVLLAIVSFTVLVFGRVRRWEVAYVLLLFLAYGLNLEFFLPDLYRIWRTELFGGYPLSLVSHFMGPFFFLIFPIAGLGLIVLSYLLVGMRELVVRRGNVFFSKAPKPLFVIMGLIFLATISSAFVLWKYSAFIAVEYGGLGFLFLIHSWKIAFGLLGLIGLRQIGVSYRRTSNDSALAWLLGLACVVAMLAAYLPLTRYSGLWDIDERFAEFAYYPALYFVTVGLNYLASRLPRRVFEWVGLPLFSLYTIPSIIAGTRIHTYVLKFLGL